ncbi:hypothetical protein D0860_01549 [Hortaea werneckii]|uniref:Uncharacterized protein n=1 Tax=Hortaea werneckii TaxID=91943 RepID=A0A3M7HQW6_HORWE|nr:hypothetical protein D0860_01549 [Hortaea werneckii]
MTIVIPYMINPDEADLGGKMGFFFGALSALGLVWSFFRCLLGSSRVGEWTNVANLSAQGISGRIGVVVVYFVNRGAR